MRDHRALRHARRARRVLDLRGRCRRDARQCQLRIARLHERGEVGEAVHVAQIRQLAAQLLDDREHRTAAELRLREARDGLRLPQAEANLGLAERRVDRHQHHAGERDAALENGPLGNVRRPDRDVIAGPVTAEQCASERLGIAEQLAVRPPPSRGARDPFDDRQSIGRDGDSATQQITDCHVEHGRLVRT